MLTDGAALGGPTDPSDGDRADAEAAVELAVELLRAAGEHETRADRRRARRLQRLTQDEAGMALSLALTDEVARIVEPRRATRRLRALVRHGGVPGTLDPIDRLSLRLGALVSIVAPTAIDRAVAWRLRRESSGVVLPAEEPAFTRYVSRRRRADVDLNVNVLGEAILGRDDAARRLDEILTRVGRSDVDYVSVKVSSVCAQVTSLAFDRSLSNIAGPLRSLYRAAADADPPVFVNLDMEEYKDLELTLTAFRSLLDEPALAGLDAGIVLQAYLPDAHAAFEQLAPWARRRFEHHGGRTRVRIVKGANLAMEGVEAELHGWTMAPYGSKEEVDASYKRLVDRALDPTWGDGVQVGVASHNLFDVAWAQVRAARHGTRHRLQAEMLEGMANGAAAAVRQRTGGIRLYAPVVHRSDFDAAIAYLVRRLDENTSPENFLGHHLDLVPGSTVFDEQRDRFLTAVRDRHTVDVVRRRSQDRTTEDRRFPLGQPFANEPDTDWSIPANRAWLARNLEGADRLVVDVPIVGGDTVHPADDDVGSGIGTDPSRDGEPRYRYALADGTVVKDVIATAVEAQTRWGAEPAGHRAALLARVAEHLAAHRGEAIAVMAVDAGKTAAQADPEVSEAVDMANFYAREALRLDGFDAVHAPLGPVVVAPPWNFPFAIPAGGVLAALAAGNVAILKPAPETVLTAWWLACWLWEAGVPRDVLQFAPCPDDDVGRSLITHPDVGAVVLTGSVDTARLFLGWKPDLRLHAETSGKNAMVITAAADVDQAVRDLVVSAFGHAGQKCSAVSVAIVEQSVLDDGRFLGKLADATRTLHVGPATDPSVDVGPLIGPPREALARALGPREGDERWLVEPRCLDRTGHLWSPGIAVGVAPGSFLHRTECFGPVLAVLPARDLDHALELQNDTAFGLTGGLHTLDPSEIERWLAGVEVGNAYVNRSTTGAIVRRQPFGGWKRSVVGPGAKAGGPHHVASLCGWADGAGDRVARAQRSYPPAWDGLRTPRDPSALRAERNEHRLVALTRVVLRVEHDADPVDVELCRLAAATTGTELVVSDARSESVPTLCARLRAIGVERLRVVGRATDELRRAVHTLDLFLDDRTPVADGSIELHRWSREQAVSITAHRHGNIRPTLPR